MYSCHHFTIEFARRKDSSWRDIRLTLGLYTHVELHDQTAAIESLPGPSDAAKPEVDDNPPQLGVAG